MKQQLRPALALFHGLAISTIVACVPNICFGAEEISIDVLKAGCKTAICNISSGKGKVTVRTWENRDGAISDFESTYEMSFSGTRYRFSEDETVLRNDTPPGRDPKKMIPVGSTSHREIAIDDSAISVLIGNKATTSSARARNGLTEAIYNECMTNLSLHNNTTTGNGLVDIGAVEQTFSGKHYLGATTVITNRETIDDSECICLEVSGRGSSDTIANRIIRYWIDPKKGFSIPQVRAFYQGGPYAELTLSNETSAEMKEYTPGIWYPTKVTRDYYKTDNEGKLIKFRKITITYAPDFEVNVPLKDESLFLVFPSKTSVYDGSLDAIYSVP